MKDQTNVIQFPKSQSAPTPAQRPPAAKGKSKPAPSLWITAGSLFAIAIATGTTNLSLFDRAGSTELASVRGIASVEQTLPESRDAAWEKSIAESLASTEVRDLASVSVGHEASLDEKVRYGILERKYTILRDLQRNEIESIVLQGAESEPSMVSNRAEFLGKYGRWMSDKYGFSELKSSELVKDRRMESFTVFDSGHKAYAVAKFELDSFGRLLAFHFEPL